MVRARRRVSRSGMSVCSEVRPRSTRSGGETGSGWTVGFWGRHPPGSKASHLPGGWRRRQRSVWLDLAAGSCRRPDLSAASLAYGFRCASALAGSVSGLSERAAVYRAVCAPRCAATAGH